MCYKYEKDIILDINIRNWCFVLINIETLKLYELLKQLKLYWIIPSFQN